MGERRSQRRVRSRRTGWRRGHVSRREFLQRSGGGLGGLALGAMLDRDTRAANDERALPHHPPRARRVVQIFLSGAASQCDTFDYKPLLVRKNGEAWDPGEHVELFQSAPGHCMASPWKFRPRGECGKWVSDLVPEIGDCVDDIAFVHSLTSRSNVHGPATFLQATGFVNPGFPAMGSWVSYGLGSMTDELPTFVVLPDARGYAPNGPANWSAGFLPALHQGTMIRPDRPEPIRALFPPVEAEFVSAESETATRALLAELDREHQEGREDDTRLEARIASYAMAARLQLSAPEVLELRGETTATRALYGLDDPVTEDLGRRCLLARRLLERGVRFVQVWSGADNGFPRRNWDSHEDLERDHGTMGRSMDRPVAALLKDLRSRGMLDDTLVLWTTEFGRMPCSQGNRGRDHNPFGFTSWLAGGGIRGGVSYGATDEWSWKAVEKPVEVYDLHATALHLLGLDHERLTFRIDGIDRRLTDVHGRVLEELIA